ncbi:MAG: hypothetical protein LBU09_02270 [Endomicrobium sp.]|jgi:hypothetical protein|nr:hypothetical protein [Endomicrobium sp.]
MEIKFAHNYLKLWEQKSAVLIAVQIIKIPDELNDSLKMYDTTYYADSDTSSSRVGGINNYELPSGECLQLIFLGNKRIPFCTIRARYGRRGDMYEYYSRLLCRRFEITVKR